MLVKCQLEAPLRPSIHSARYDRRYGRDAICHEFLMMLTEQILSDQEKFGILGGSEYQLDIHRDKGGNVVKSDTVGIAQPQIELQSLGNVIVRAKRYQMARTDFVRAAGGWIASFEQLIGIDMHVQKAVTALQAPVIHGFPVNGRCEAIG